MKGLLKKVDAEHAYETMRRNHMPGGMMSVNTHYIEEGFSPGNAGTTVQWAFEDWVLAQMARKLGDASDYEYFLRLEEALSPGGGIVAAEKGRRHMATHRPAQWQGLGGGQRVAGDMVGFA
jgi:hypothetical protein